MTLLARRTSRGYAGNVVDSASDLLLFFSVHCLPDRSDVMSAAVMSKQKAAIKHASTTWETACGLCCDLDVMVADCQLNSQKPIAGSHTHVYWSQA